VPIGMEPPIPQPFVAVVQRLPPCVHRLLIDNAEPSSISTDTLLTALDRHSPSARKAASAGDVMQLEGVLSHQACAALRGAVDAQRTPLHPAIVFEPHHAHVLL